MILINKLEKVLENLDKPKKGKPKKTGKRKKKVNRGKLLLEQEKQKAIELERKEKEKEPVKTIQSLGNAWQTQMILNKSKLNLFIKN